MLLRTRIRNRRRKRKNRTNQQNLLPRSANLKKQRLWPPPKSVRLNQQPRLLRDLSNGCYDKHASISLQVAHSLLTRTPTGFSRSLLTKTPTTQRSISATAPKTDFEHARNRLHVKAVPDSLPCREDEFLEIQEHLESAIEDGTGSCICMFAKPNARAILLQQDLLNNLKRPSFVFDITRHLWSTRNRQNSNCSRSYSVITGKS